MQQQSEVRMKKYVNIGILPATREKLREIAKKTNGKKHQIVADAINDYEKKILHPPTKADGRIVENPR